MQQHLMGCIVNILKFTHYCSEAYNMYVFYSGIHLIGISVIKDFLFSSGREAFLKTL